MSGHRHAHLSEIAPLPGPGGEGGDWRPVRHHFGIESFGVGAWIGHRPGDTVIEEHDELPEDGVPGHEELYVVTRGTARFRVGDEEFSAPPGTLVHVRDPALVRSAKAVEPGTTVLAVGAAPGRAFAVSPWERRALERAGTA